MAETTQQAPRSAGDPAPAPRKRRRGRAALLFLVAHLLGVVSSVDALMSTRTSQGTIAWIVSLNAFPIVSVPAYWVFGRSRFQGYVTARQQMHELSLPWVDEVERRVQPFVVDPTLSRGAALAGARLAELPYLRGNAVELLVDGDATFKSILGGIDAATEYLLVQFYIVRDDELGRALQRRLIERSRAGVEVWFLYDEIGTRGVSSYLTELREAGVHVSSFHSTRGTRNRFQLNFRNHRKIVVADGRSGWVGGLNVGNEYTGHDPKWPGWRDTHMKLSGPAVLELQLSFVEDWRWATDEFLDLSWEPVAAADGDGVVLILPSGPADRLETCSLMYQQAIHAAQQRIWIASPYFVPDPGVTSALHLAALRGVDVQIIIPDVPDSKAVYYSAYAFLGELLRTGVRVHRYLPGFMHQKVFLVDDVVAGVGTANFDNRSFRLNFEVTALVHDERFLRDVEAMFEADFARSRRMTVQEIAEKPWWFRVLSRASFLAAPLL